jgi:hypothetical protein
MDKISGTMCELRREQGFEKPRKGLHEGGSFDQHAIEMSRPKSTRLDDHLVDLARTSQ